MSFMTFLGGYYYKEALSEHDSVNEALCCQYNSQVLNYTANEYLKSSTSIKESPLLHEICVKLCKDISSKKNLRKTAAVFSIQINFMVVKRQLVIMKQIALPISLF